MVSVATGRRLEYSGEFERALQSFAKKDRRLREQVGKVLELRLQQGPGNDPKLQRVEGCPVFKTRIPAQGCGKRGGARVIYYCDHERLLPLLIYLKSEKENTNREDIGQIRNALQAAGLWPE